MSRDDASPIPLPLAGAPMRPTFVNAPLVQLIVLSALVALSASPLHAQAGGSPIRRALYVALGGDPVRERGYTGEPVAVSAGIEQTRTGSRWGLSPWRRLSAANEQLPGQSRWEDFGWAFPLAMAGRQVSFGPICSAASASPICAPVCETRAIMRTPMACSFALSRTIARSGTDRSRPDSEPTSRLAVFGCSRKRA